MPSTKVVSSTKCRARDTAIQRVADSLKEEKDALGDVAQYLEADISEIVRKIEVKEWTASAVTKAYILRAIEAQGAVNAITEVLFDDALKQAKELDEEFATTGRLRGPLHGVPVTAKDLFNIEGLDSTIGYTTFVNRPATDTAEVVELVRKAGGIVFAKTNVPQTMLTFECSNPLWGRTLNPLKKTALKNSKVPVAEQERPFTCGGSSGGEGAMLACDASALGLGTDIGGSLRIPAAFCGIYSLKPSPGRASLVGTTDPAPGFDAITVSSGPMGRSVNDVRVGAKVLLGSKGSTVPIPYRQEEAQTVIGKKLKFGYYLSDGVAKASPACQRAVMESVDALRKEGHECIQFTPPRVDEATAIFIGLTAADGYHTLLSHLGPDPKEEGLFLATVTPNLPKLVRRFGAWAIKTFMHDEMFAYFFRSSKMHKAQSYFRVAAQRDEYVRMFNKEVWEKMGFDGIISPVLAAPALPHGATKTLLILGVGTLLWNIVPSSVGVIPVTHVDPAKDQLTEEWLKDSPLAKKLGSSIKPKSAPEPSPRNSSEKPAGDKPAGDGEATVASAPSAPPAAAVSKHETGLHGSPLIEEDLYAGGPMTKKSYDPDAMAGLPVGIQIVGRLYEDEKVVEMMGIVEEALGDPKARGFGPGSGAKYL
ncbi:amidase signature enzyme [Clavulina sp. PMI_390]|nr:amidase signature enzyme [Clavulina sp. PMI_390]